MEFFKKAKEEFLKFNFKECLENILQSLKFESLPKQAEKDLLDILQTLFENKTEFYEQFFNIGESFFEKQKYPYALRIFDGLLPLSPQKNIERNLFYIFICSAYIGQLKTSKDAAKKLLYLRYKMKYLERGLELLNQIKNFNISDKLIQEYTIKFALIKKDIPTFNLVFNQLAPDYDSEEFWSYALEVEEKAKSEFKDWIVSKNYLKLLAVYKLSQLVDQNISCSLERKEFIYLIYQYKIRYPLDLFVYPLLLEYAIFYKRESLEQSISSYFARNPKKFMKNEKIRNRILNLLNGPRVNLKKEAEVIAISPDLNLSVRELNLITPKVDKELKDFAAVSERVMIKAIDLLDEDVFINYYNDLVACFAAMEFYQAALFILDKIENTLGANSKIKESLNIDYLRIDFFIKIGRCHEAIAMADDAAFYKPLFLKEKIGFLYLKAEALMKIGKTQEASDIYRLIKEKYPSFRLVKERLKDFESFK